MRSRVKMPKLGDTADQVVVLEWFVAVGERVEVGAPLMRVETDKVEADVPSPVTGVLVEQVVAAEAEVVPGDVVAVLETS